MTMCTLCIISCQKEVIHVDSVSLEPSAITIKEGEAFILTKTVKPSDATNKNVKWETSDPSVATVIEGTVLGLKAGSCYVKIISEDGERTAVCNVTVTASVFGISLKQKAMTVGVGESADLEVVFIPENASNRAVKWSSSDDSVAKVNASGTVQGVSTGNTTITATAVDGGATATCYVTVVSKVSEVTLNHSELYLSVGDTESLIATVKPDNATNKKIKWTSSDSSVVTVDSNGKISAVNLGQATITATSEEGGKTATCVVNVIVPVTGISLNMTSITLSIGGYTTLTPIITPSNASIKTVNWISSNDTVASVSGNGIVTAKSAGSATIKAQTVDGGFTATCVVTVISKVTGVKLSDTSIKLLPGDKKTISVSIEPSDATNKEYTIASSSPSVATVDKSGVVTAVSLGEATITVTTSDGGYTATCSVKVVDISSFVSASYNGGSMMVSNDLILSGSKLNFSVNNASTKTIKVKTCQLTDGVTGQKGNVMTINTDIEGGKSTGWSITIGSAGIHKPKATFVYEYAGKQYETSAQYKSF